MRYLLITFLVFYSTIANAAQLTIETSNGLKHHFNYELANDQNSRKIGLMNRDFMAKDHSMLFIFDEPIVANMWMKNTYIPLDMLFIDQSGEIIKIAQNAEPHSLEIISSDKKVVAVLEINAMVSNDLGINVGDKLLELNKFYKVN